MTGLQYRIAVMETLQRCTPLPFTEGLGGAVAGRPLGDPIQNPQTSTQTQREKSMADTENTLILETTQGPVTIEMRPDLAPGHVARIKELVREGFYDGIVFHRVIEGFMAQTGCPQGTGTGGSGKKLKAEFNKEPHVRGTTSMARAASPDSGDSQFFICFDDASFLNGQYTVWGKVTDGMENVDKIKRGEPVQNPGQDRQGADGGRRGLIVPPHGAEPAKQASRTREAIDANNSGPHPARRALATAQDEGRQRADAMRTDLFDFELPPDKHRAAAGEPARCRADAGGAAGDAVLRDRAVADLPQWLQPGDQLVVNDTKVIAAQLKGRRIGRETEPKIEATLIKRLDGSRWQALVKPAKKLAAGRHRSASAMRARSACSAISTRRSRPRARKAR